MAKKPAPKPPAAEGGEKTGGKGKLKMKMVLTAEGTGLKHVVEGDIDLG